MAPNPTKLIAVARTDYPTLTEFPTVDGLASIFTLMDTGDGVAWGSTTLPIWVFGVNPPDAPVLNPFGAQRDVPLVGDRGEVYTFVSLGGEVWGGLYGAINRIVRFTPAPAVGYDVAGVNRGWRPKGATTDGTSIYWVGENVGALGMVVVSEADGSAVHHTGICDQALECCDFHDGVLYACGGAEGIPGEAPVATFFAIDPATMTVLWSAELAGSRALSMHRVSATEYVVISHLTGDTTVRLILVDIVAEARSWWVAPPGVTNFGSARNCLREWLGELWTLCDGGLYVVDLPNQRLVKRCRIDGGFQDPRIRGIVVQPDRLLVAAGTTIYETQNESALPSPFAVGT